MDQGERQTPSHYWRSVDRCSSIHIIASFVPSNPAYSVKTSHASIMGILLDCITQHCKSYFAKLISMEVARQFATEWWIVACIRTMLVVHGPKGFLVLGGSHIHPRHLICDYPESFQKIFFQLVIKMCLAVPGGTSRHTNMVTHVHLQMYMDWVSWQSVLNFHPLTFSNTSQHEGLLIVIWVLESYGVHLVVVNQSTSVATTLLFCFLMPETPAQRCMTNKPYSQHWIHQNSQCAFMTHWKSDHGVKQDIDVWSSKQEQVGRTLFSDGGQILGPTWSYAIEQCLALKQNTYFPFTCSRTCCAFAPQPLSAFFMDQ